MSVRLFVRHVKRVVERGRMVRDNVKMTGPQQLAAKPPSDVLGPSRLAC